MKKQEDINQQILKTLQLILKKLDTHERTLELLAEMKEQEVETLTHAQAAEYLGIGKQSLYNLVNKGIVARIDNDYKKNIYSVAELNKYKYGKKRGNRSRTM